MHLTALSERRSLSTIELRRAAVLAIRRRLGRPLHLDDGTFPEFLQGLRRAKSARPAKKAALLEENLRAVMLLLDPKSAPDPKRHLRNRALLLTGFAAGFRRSELAGFDLRDLSVTAEGLVLFVAGSKTDQERRGEEIGIQAVPNSPLCAVTSVSAWLAVRGDAPGPLFCRIDRGGHLTYGADGRLQPINSKTVARLVKRVIKGTGLARGHQGRSEPDIPRCSGGSRKRTSGRRLERPHGGRSKARPVPQDQTLSITSSSTETGP